VHPRVSITAGRSQPALNSTDDDIGLPHSHHSAHIRDRSFTVSRIMLDRRTTLCLACSSSLPPNVDDSELFMTKCCQRPICPRCLEANPRLARYNPCLVCLAGVGVIQASSSIRNRSGGQRHVGGSGVQSVRVENLDGGVKDHELFVLGDDGEDDEDDDVSTDGEDHGQFLRSATPPPPDVIPTVFPLLETPSPPPVTNHTEESPNSNATPAPPTSNGDQRSLRPDAPVIYRLRRGDTLMGIALRFRLDVRSFHKIMPFLPQFSLIDRMVRRWSCVG